MTLNVLIDFVKKNKVVPFVIITLLGDNLISMSNLVSKYILEKTISLDKEKSKTKLALIKFMIICMLMWIFITGNLYL
jgi:hypothetical protein